MDACKVYVEVRAAFGEDGRISPLEIRWTDGRVFPIDRVLDVRPAPALKAGGQGDRYTVRIGGRESFLFFEHSARPSGGVFGRWFVERK